MCDDIAEQQAEITRMLLRHVQAPLADGVVIRGILPAPPPTRAVRVVLGADASSYTPDDFVVHEIPLGPEDELLTPWDVRDLLRALVRGTHHYSDDSVSRVMGMTMFQMDPSAVKPAPPEIDDNTMSILQVTGHPFTEEWPTPRLRGFLFLSRERLRLYLDQTDQPGVTAADVRASGAVTALLAALSSLVNGGAQRTVDPDDPHCDRLVDLTHW
jgi:hypothetical protein